MPQEFSTWKTRDRLGKIDFPLASETATLQAADLLSHLTYLQINAVNDGRKLPDELIEVWLACLINNKGKENMIWMNEATFSDMAAKGKLRSPNWIP